MKNNNRESIPQMKVKERDGSPLDKQGIDYLAQAEKGGHTAKMAKKGYAQGEMGCVADDISQGGDQFSQRGFSKTTEYIERNNSMQKRAASGINKQEYKGRYS
jgi:hypothetical protein